MQSAYHIAVPYSQASGYEKWSYLHKSFMGQLHFASYDKGNGVLKFKTEDEARTWWNENSSKVTNSNIQISTSKIYIIKRIAAEKNEKSRRICRIIKEL